LLIENPVKDGRYNGVGDNIYYKSFGKIIPNQNPEPKPYT
jgi:hypothetical protein